MQTFNILFYYLSQPHIASVQYNPFTSSYTIYFTDVELILEFGSKAELNSKGEFNTTKEGVTNNLDNLKEVIKQELDKISLVA